MTIVVRSIGADELGAFASVGGDRDDSLAGVVSEMWSTGESRPDDCFVAELDGVAVGRVGIAARAVADEIPLLEHRLFGLQLPWDAADHLSLGRTLLQAALEAALPSDARIVDSRLNAETHDHLVERRAVLEGAGFGLFQEKQGFVWHDDGQTASEDSHSSGDALLVFRTIADIGRERYGALMAAAQVGTLDRNDRYYLRLSGEPAWGRIMTGFLTPGEERGWLAATTPAGEDVGFVAVGSFDEPTTGTIVHIGVLPGQRGRGHIHDLLRAAARAASELGFATMLSDVDVDNAPMTAAMVRAGHSPTDRPWHIWHYRLEV